jgi:hypothetical protein
MLSKNTKKKLIANQFSRSKVINCMRELLTRRWNTWHSKRHCVFTAGGERVNLKFKCERVKNLVLILSPPARIALCFKVKRSRALHQYNLHVLSQVLLLAKMLVLSPDPHEHNDKEWTFQSLADWWVKE